MSDEPNKGLQSPFRRKLLMGAAALPLISMLPRPSFGAGPATATVNTTGLAVTDTEVTVGILHSATGTMARGGSGLGLSIVQAVVGAHGGRVELSSQVGVGTTVRVLLPLADADADADAGAPGPGTD